MSHFVTLVNFNLPEIEENQTDNAKNAMHIAALKEVLKTEPDNFVAKFTLGRLNGLGSTFEREASSMIDELMKPFCECTEDPQYLEFEDKTQEITEGYEKNTVDCVRFPNGTIHSSYHQDVYSRFTIKDGKVYQKKAGPLHHEKRTKKAKKMTALVNYPVKKLYGSVEEYAEDHCCYSYNEAHQAYGYMYNPNSFWDWYSMGGRWPFQFLVKDTAERIVGERSWGNDDAKCEAPDGYIWVCGARKKDIEWDMMKEQQLQAAKREYAILSESFSSGQCPEGSFWRITEEGIVSFVDMIYFNGESEDEYLTRHGLAPEQRLLPGAYSFLRDGEWVSKGDMGWWGISTNDKEIETWRQMMAEYLDSIPDDDVIVGIDCHI